MTPDEAIDVIARAVLMDLLPARGIDWGDHPLIGEHDWARVVDRVDAIVDFRTDEYDAAYALLAERAEKPGYVVTADDSGVLLPAPPDPEPTGYVWANPGLRTATAIFPTYEAACAAPEYWAADGWQVCTVTPVRIETPDDRSAVEFRADMASSILDRPAAANHPTAPIGYAGVLRSGDQLIVSSPAVTPDGVFRERPLVGWAYEVCALTPIHPKESE